MLRTVAEAWLAQGTPAVIVEVAATRGSTPREAGTRMLVSAERTAGTIGGGHLEWRAIADARAWLEAGTARIPVQRVALGPALGQCCGGALELRFERLQPAHLSCWPQETPRFALQLYGAGHVGRAIVALLARLPCRVQWIDAREDEFPADAGEPPHIRRLCVEPVEDEVPGAAPGSFFLVLTHRHDLDLALSEAILRRGDFGFFGLIGSRTKRARFEHRLRERGIAAEDLARMSCPIGLPGITGKEPDVIAVAVVAQLLQAASRPGAGAGSGGTGTVLEPQALR
jgi:xanthine dehydrogenase accessory factor